MSCDISLENFILYKIFCEISGQIIRGKQTPNFQHKQFCDSNHDQGQEIKCSLLFAVNMTTWHLPSLFWGLEIYLQLGGLQF
jgi:hypothetical protein